jgi:FkbM family methyltransferase
MHRQRLFVFIASILRALPIIPGKVRIGLYVYKKLNPHNENFSVKARLFPENLKFSLNLACLHERMAYLMGHYENDTSDFLVELYSGGIFLDVGANIGLIALPFAERTRHNLHFRLPKPHVYAVEAMPGNYKSLCKNIALNNLHADVKAINIGLAAKTDEVFIQIEGNNPDKTGTANVLPNHFDFIKIPLQVYSIDELIERGDLSEDISLIKIDTDGYDFEILKGSKNLLMNRRPIIFAELAEHCMNWHGYGITQVVEYMTTLEYQVWLKEQSGYFKFIQYDSSIPYVMDCLLVPSEKMKELSIYLI